MAIVLSSDDKLNLSNGIMLQKVGEFRYLADILGAVGGYDSAVNGEGHKCLEKFCAYLPVKGKGKRYTCSSVLISDFRGSRHLS